MFQLFLGLRSLHIVVVVHAIVWIVLHIGNLSYLSITRFKCLILLIISVLKQVELFFAHIGEELALHPQPVCLHDGLRTKVEYGLGLLPAKKLIELIYIYLKYYRSLRAYLDRVRRHIISI